MAIPYIPVIFFFKCSIKKFPIAQNSIKHAALPQFLSAPMPGLFDKAKLCCITYPTFPQFFLFKILFSFKYGCVCGLQYPQRPGEDVKSPGAGIKDSCELSCGCWKLNSSTKPTFSYRWAVELIPPLDYCNRCNYCK